MFEQNTVKEAIGNPENQFGLCPECLRSDGFVHIGRQEWFYCRDHKTKWCTSENMLSGWREMSKEDFDKNDKMLKDYTEVEPWTHCERDEPGFLSETTVLINTVREENRVLLVEFDEMLSLYRKLSKGNPSVKINNQELHIEAIETLTQWVHDHVFSAMARQSVKNLTQMVNLAVEERNADIDGVEASHPGDPF